MTQQLRPGAFLHLILECVIGVLGVFGSILCLCTVEIFDLPVPDALFFVVPVLMLGFCLLFRQRRGGLWGAAAGLLIAVLILLLRRTIFPSAEALWNTLVNHYANTYDAVRLIHPKTVPTDPAEAEAAILTLAVIQTWLVALSLARWHRAIPAILALGLGILPCYIALNTMPALLPLMMAVLSILLQILTQSVRRREPRETWKALLWALVLSLLLLGGLLYFNPRDSYRQPFTWRQLAKRIEDFGADLNNRGNVDAGLSGNPDAVEFRNLRSLPNRPVSFLRVTADYTGVCYLRGSAYSGFDGSSWFRVEGRQWPEKVVFPYLNAELEARHVLIETLEDETAFYTAYEMLRLPMGGKTEGDSWYRNLNGSTRYSFPVSLDPGAAVPYTDPEYEAWVRETCTALPEQTREALTAWWRGQGGTPPGSSVEDLAELVAERVSGCAVYDRSPDPQPRDTDFCTWFLNDAESGYCVHYATAAAAVLRSLGIPSRYVSGYILQCAAQKTVEVTNINAHAWVEYFDGGVWHRLEPTPGEAAEFAGFSPGSTVEPEPVTAPPRTTEPLPSGETGESTEPTSRETDRPPLPDQPTRPTETEKQTPESEPSSPSGGKSEPWTLPKWMRIPLGAAAFLLLVVLRRTLVNLLRERKLSRKPPNERARLLYHRYRRLCRVTKARENPKAEALAKKAVFSQHQIQRDELEFLRQCVDQQVALADVSSLRKRVWYRYVLAII